MFPLIKKYSQSNYHTGKVSVDTDLCTGCHQCALICPASALQITKDKKSSMIPLADCISCGDCTAVCHTNAITIESFYNIPDGFYQTDGRIQPSGKQAFPRFFPAKSVKKGKGK